MDALRRQLATARQQLLLLQAQLYGGPPPASPLRSPATPVPTGSPSGGETVTASGETVTASGGQVVGSDVPPLADSVPAGSGSDGCAGDTSSGSTGAFFGVLVAVTVIFVAGGAGLFLHRRALRAARAAVASGGHPSHPGRMAAGSVVQNAAYMIDGGGGGADETGPSALPAQIPAPTTPYDKLPASAAALLEGMGSVAGAERPGPALLALAPRSTTGLQLQSDDFTNEEEV